MCECGYMQKQHVEEATRPHAFQGNQWDPKKHVQEMPTDAFGDIVFTGLGQKMGKVGFCHSIALSMDQRPLLGTCRARTSWCGEGGWTKAWGHSICPVLGAGQAVRHRAVRKRA